MGPLRPGTPVEGSTSSGIKFTDNDLGINPGMTEADRSDAGVIDTPASPTPAPASAPALYRDRHRHQDRRHRRRAQTPTLTLGLAPTVIADLVEFGC
jgi:hypothetical protein